MLDLCVYRKEKKRFATAILQYLELVHSNKNKFSSTKKFLEVMLGKYSFFHHLAKHILNGTIKHINCTIIFDKKEIESMGAVLKTYFINIFQVPTIDLLTEDERYSN